MRAALKGVEEFTDIRTDLDNRSCTLKVKKDFDVAAKLTELATKTSEIDGFKIN